MIAPVNEGLPIETTARARSRIALFAAGVVAIFAILETLRGGPSWELVLAARATWIVALLTSSWLVLAVRGRWTQVLLGGTVALSIGALLVLSVARPADVGAVAFLFAAPLLVGVLVPDARGAVWLAAGLSTVAVGASFLLRGAPIGDVLAYAFRAAAAGAIAVLGATTLERVRREEIRVAEERARAVEALARSELRRAEVEPLAAAGRTAARVAHDMSNPLASIRVNLDWLSEVAAERRLEADEAEVLEVLRETRECVDRLGANLADFRAAARGARPAPAVRGEGVSDEGGAKATVAHLAARSKA
jgi:signal transduction histidine kinase